MTPDQDEVLAAAAAIIEAFGNHDVEAYFSCFAHDASFLFHTEPEMLTSRAEYEQKWGGWEATGFRVMGCRSLEPRARLLTDQTAVFTHRVRTSVLGVVAELAERETIIFRRIGPGRWLGVHEHLSTDPQDDSLPTNQGKIS